MTYSGFFLFNKDHNCIRPLCWLKSSVPENPDNPDTPDNPDNPENDSNEDYYDDFPWDDYFPEDLFGNNDDKGSDKNLDSKSNGNPIKSSKKQIDISKKKTGYPFALAILSLLALFSLAIRKN